MAVSFPLIAALKTGTGSSTHPEPRAAGPRCPECTGPVHLAAGCMTCPACGWGKCG